MVFPAMRILFFQQFRGRGAKSKPSFFKEALFGMQRSLVFVPNKASCKRLRDAALYTFIHHYIFAAKSKSLII